MTDIMKLADDYAQSYMSFGEPSARAALQSAIESLQSENGQLHASLQSSRTAFEQVCKHRDALQSKLDAAHAVLDSDDSKIVRNAADGYPEGREPRELALSERVEALCTYATDWKRWCEEVQSKLDELQRQEPVAHQFQTEIDKKWHNFIDDEHYHHTADDGRWPIRALYAAPKALEPVAVVDANDDGYWADILPDRSVKVGQQLFAAPNALEPLTPQRIQELHEQVLREPIRTSGFFESFTRAVEAAHGITKGTP